MSFDWIHSLPPELWLVIFQEVGSPRDLYALVRTSKVIYTIFQQHQISILSAVLQNAVPKDIFPDFILAQRSYLCCSHSPRWAGIDYDRPSQTPSTVERWQSVAAHLSTVEYQTPGNFLKDLDTLHSLCKLWFLLDFFVEDFVATIFIDLQKSIRSCSESGTASISTSALYQANTYPLSTTERGRIFRALCRFEENRRLFHCQLGVANALTSRLIRQTHNDFSARYQRWEHMEMYTILWFLHDKVEQAMKQAQEGAIAKLEASIQETEGQSYSVEKSSYDGFGRSKLNLFGPPFSYSRDIGFITQLGLPFLKCFLDSDPEYGIAFVSKFFSPERSRDCNNRPSYDLGPQKSVPSKGATGRSSDHPLLNPPPCWHLSSDIENSTRGPTGREIVCVRMGFMMWDQARLETMAPNLSREDMPNHLPKFVELSFYGSEGRRKVKEAKVSLDVLERMRGRIEEIEDSIYDENIFFDSLEY